MVSWLKRSGLQSPIKWQILFPVVNVSVIELLWSINSLMTWFGRLYITPITTCSAWPIVEWFNSMNRDSKYLKSVVRSLRSIHVISSLINSKMPQLFYLHDYYEGSITLIIIRVNIIRRTRKVSKNMFLVMIFKMTHQNQRKPIYYAISSGSTAAST